KLTNHSMEIGCFAFRDLLSPAHRQCNLVTKPITDKVHEPSEHERDHEAVPTPNGASNAHEPSGHSSQQDDGFQRIFHESDTPSSCYTSMTVNYLRWHR